MAKRKFLKPLHKQRISDTMTARHTAYNLAVEYWRCKMLRDNYGAKKAADEWIRIGRAAYEKLAR